jgi:hypothetical protein
MSSVQRLTVALALLLAACVPAQERSCSAVRTQLDAGLIVGSGAIIIGGAAAIDPAGVIDSREKRHVRTDIELAAAAVALGGIVAVHAAGWDMQQCQETPHD